MADRKSPIKDTYARGNDAAYIKPKLVPDFELLPRDDSGGPEWDGYTAEWGDGGYSVGENEKGHLHTDAGRQHPQAEDEVSAEPREKAAKRAEGIGTQSPPTPASSKRNAKL